MRCIVALVFTFVLVACRTAPDTRAQKAASPSVEYLLTSAATDFQQHRPPYPAQFRDVRSGYVPAPDGTRQYLLCGEFLPVERGGKTQWTPFVTIRTSGYEQYLGDQAAHFCKRSIIAWDSGDLSSSLQSRLDSLR